MSGPRLRDQADRLRAIPLEAVLQAWGAQRDRYDPHKWHTSRGVLSVTGTRFMNWNCGQGGGGAIDLVIHLTRRPFPEALRWLGTHSPDPLDPPAHPPPPLPTFPLPASAPEHLQRVKNYLTTQRGLAVALIESLIQSGSLYADPRANAVFLLRDPQGQPVGAELRGTTRVPWRGMAPGSRKDRGYFAIPVPPVRGPADRKLILCESAIDALSCFTLDPQSACLSTAGARPNPRWLAWLLEQGSPVYCAFDADVTGEAMAQAMLTLHPTIQRLRPSCKDWNDVLRSQS